ncbi:universal stress protein [Mucilaginibacter sp. CAU 1740]|uniref:universal stress protein n=1 Tax=Mucilaginibacter sp. CAU 1740 TaxID=3140365 RepID=UPI00325B832B
MKTIIAATDFSALAGNAVDYAAAVARSTQGKLILFNAYSVPVPGANGLLSPADYDNFLLHNHERLESKAKAIADTYAIEVICETSYCSVNPELEALILKYQADLVVLGMEPDSLTQDVFGNTTTALIGNLSCPVLAVPESAGFDGVSRIVFACDAAQDFPAGSLAKVKVIAEAFRAEVEVFFVEAEAGELPAAESLLAEELKGIVYSYKKLRSDAIIQSIRQETLACGAELLIMAPKVYGFWSSLFHQSKTRRMASGLNIPMMALNTNDRAPSSYSDETHLIRSLRPESIKAVLE